MLPRLLVYELPIITVEGFQEEDEHLTEEMAMQEYARHTLRLEQVASGLPAERVGGLPAACRHCWVSSPRQVRPGLLHQGKVDQGQPEGEACMVQQEVCKAEEERRCVKALAMNKQGTWTRWESVRERALAWQNIWSMEGHRIKFLLCSVYDVPPTPSNLHTWGLAESPSCTHCRRQARQAMRNSSGDTTRS